MNLTLKVRPLSAWSWPTTRQPIQAPFRGPGGRRTSWSKTVDLLARELRMLGVHACILELDVRESDIRVDGWIRAQARPSSHRIVITFEHARHGWLRYPCDRFTQWQDNVRAVALGLEALRKVDRYGVSPSGEQYAGWRALPAQTGAVMTSTKAAEVVANLSGAPGSAEQILRDWTYAQGRVREALRKTHPDTGGDADAGEFHTVQTARKVLAAHHGVAA